MGGTIQGNFSLDGRAQFDPIENHPLGLQHYGGLAGAVIVIAEG
jgi:hypothetical protein